ncbi:hypothetical protein IMCC26134_13560 [Verrucomicrobia bacterium IMCC26134]|jgi:DUF1365 family protein|nr:hypothetical protein IMCC26134_13560 [Verrucomicrobia bacterium IMCC26134]
MNSRIYECHIMHARLHPKAHRFGYNLFMLALDLDELPEIALHLRVLRINATGILSFRERDYLPTDRPAHNPSHAPSAPAPLPTASATRAPLKARVLDYLAAHGVATQPDVRVVLITLPRVFGYQFNPVSFYFVSTADGTPLASIAEVTNTFRETKPFLLGPATLGTAASAPAFHLRIPKNFYVSPFTDVDVAFDFHLRPPGDRLALQIDDYIGSRRTLLTTVSGRPRALRDRTLAWFGIKYPFVTLQVIAAIHWQALRLYLKNVPWFAKAARPADQRDLYHPHASLTADTRP